MWSRVPRDAGIVCAVMAAMALVLWPANWRVAGGVLGGGALMAVSAWAIQGLVDGLLGTGESRPSRVRLLVKFFTRHGILAVAAYGMMVRLRLDPVAMLVGLSSLVVAVGLEAVRGLRVPDDGGSGK